jgi:uncharacterized protein
MMGPQPAQAESDVSKVSLLILQATSFCNIDCRYCYLSGRSIKKLMSGDVLDALISALINDDLLGVEITVNWRAGEPLVAGVDFYHDAVARMQRLAHAGARVIHSVQTNATLIDDSWCELFRVHHFRVGVSLDGPQWLNDKFRLDRKGRGTFDRTIAGIQHLRRARIPFSVITVLTHDSTEHPDELYDFYLAHDIRVVGFNIEETEGVNRLSTSAGQALTAKFAAFLQRIQERSDADSRVLIRELDLFRRRIRERTQARNDQTVPLSILTVTAEGDFTIFSPELIDAKSERLGDFILGNVRGVIRSALATAKFTRLFDEIQRGVAACHAECCYFGLCGGGAPSNKYFENGSFGSTETDYCRSMKKTVAEVVLAGFESQLSRAETS